VKKRTPEIVYEDEWLLAINKPSGWTTLYGSGKESQLQRWLLKEQKVAIDNSGGGGFRLRTGIVHRLDRDTSGLLLVAKLPNAFDFLQNAFKKRQVKKEYLALIRGKAPRQGEIEAPIKRLPWRRDKFTVFPGGREATTEYQREGLYFKDKEFFSLVRVKLLTGRTHQIRVHFKYLGFPLAGDSLYGSRKLPLGLSRLFLHATRITFPHFFCSPAQRKKTISLQSSLPVKLQKYLETLNMDSSK